MICIETRTSLGSLQKFEGAAGEFKGAQGARLSAKANFKPWKCTILSFSPLTGPPGCHNYYRLRLISSPESVPFYHLAHWATRLSDKLLVWEFSFQALVDEAVNGMHSSQLSSGIQTGEMQHELLRFSPGPLPGLIVQYTCSCWLIRALI